MKRNRGVRNKKFSSVFICLLVAVLLINPLNLRLFVDANEGDEPDAMPFTFVLQNEAAKVGETLELVYTPLADGLTDVVITFPSNLTFLWGTWNETDADYSFDIPPAEVPGDGTPDATTPEAQPLPDATTPEAQPLPDATTPEAQPLPDATAPEVQPSTDDPDLAEDEIIIEDPLIALASYKDLIASNAGVIENNGRKITVADWTNLPGSCIMLSFRVETVANTKITIQGQLNGAKVTAAVQTLPKAGILAAGFSDYECTTHSLKWSNNVVSAGDTMSLIPESNTEQSVKLQLAYSFGGVNAALASEIQIRVPRHIFYDRDNNPIGSLDLTSLPTLTQAQAGGVSDSVSFCYYIDDTADEIVITNFRVFETGTFTCEYLYTFMPYQVSNGYTKSDIQATFTYKHEPSDAEGDIGAEITEVSNPLTVNVTTQADFYSIEQYAAGKYEAWQLGWGTAPADSANYFYIYWQISCNFNPRSTQPYTLTLVDDPGPYGELVNNAWSGPFTIDGATKTGEMFFKDVPNPDINPTSTVGIIKNYTYTRNIITRHPKALLTGDNPVTVFTNTATIRLQGVDGAAMEQTASKDYTYVPVNVNYPGDVHTITKTVSNNYAYGTLNALESGNESSYSLSPLWFTFNASSTGWDLTYDGVDYSKKNYTVDVIDDLVYLAGVRLQPGDYTFTKLSLPGNSPGYTEYNAAVDPNTGLKVTTSTDYTKYKPVIVYYKTLDNDTWQEAASITTGSSLNPCKIKPVGGVLQSFSQTYPYTLPEGAVAVKFSHTGNDYKYTLAMLVCVQVNPTEHVLEIIKNQTSCSFNNFVTLQVLDSEGNIANGNKLESSLPNTISKDIAARDTALYGSIAQHANVGVNLTRIGGDICSKTYCNVTASTPYNNATASRVEIDYTITARESLTQSYFTLQEVFDNGYLNEQTNGVFYNLLPLGAIPNLSTLYARRYADDNTTTNYSYTVRFVENWQGSQQTMMIVEVKAPDGTRNFTSGGKTNPADYVTNIYSGFTIGYTLYYPWDAYQDFGAPLINSVAYRSHTGTLVSGTAATSSSLTKKTYFSSLEDASGRADDTNKNTVYGQNSSTFTVTISAELGMTMSVKGLGDMAYASSAEVPGMGTYTYRLRFANQVTMSSKNLILYDVLEKANPGATDRWQGTLLNVDVSQATSKGIKPVVYYSTVSFPDSDLRLYKDISDTAIWSSNPPADLSAVTAVAIDLRKKTNGTEYVFQPKEAVYCYITMCTPDNYKDYINPKVYAYNRPYYSATTMAAIPYDSCEEGAIVTTSLRECDITLGSASNPPGGTQAAPSPVNTGGSLTYTLTLTNTNVAENLTDIEITDIIPDGLTIDYSHIRAAVGLSAAAPLPSARVSVVQSGQKLVFTVSKLMADEKVSLIIPCTVTADSGSFANTAVINNFGGRETQIESPTLYHEVNNTDIVFKKTINGQNPGSKTFTFILESSGGTAVTAVNDENGVVKIPIPATASGTYRYTLSEMVGNENGITYDTSVYNVKVAVVNVYGAIVPTVTYTDSEGNELNEIVFDNTYSLTPVSADLHAKVKLTGKTLAAGMFSFIATDNDSGVTYPAINEGDGSVTFTIPYDAPGQYTYLLSEISGGPGEGVTYDGTVYTAVVTVIENGDGTMTASVEYTDGAIIFTNQYTAAEAEVTLTAFTTLTGINLESAMFGFTVEDGAGQPAAAATNAADGTVTFSPIRFSQPGVYTFYITEMDGILQNIVYDKTVYRVVVTVTDDEHGQLYTAVTLPDGGIVFTNKYVKDEANTPPDNPVNPTTPEEPQYSPSNDYTYIYDPKNDQYDIYTKDGEVQGHQQYPGLEHTFIYDSHRDWYTVVDKQGASIGYVVLEGERTLEDVILSEELLPLGFSQVMPEAQSVDSKGTATSSLKANPKTYDSVVYVSVYAGIAFLLTGLIFLLSVRLRKYFAD